MAKVRVPVNLRPLRKTGIWDCGYQCSFRVVSFRCPRPGDIYWSNLFQQVQLAMGHHAKSLVILERE